MAARDGCLEPATPPPGGVKQPPLNGRGWVATLGYRSETRRLQVYYIVRFVDEQSIGGAYYFLVCSPQREACLRLLHISLPPMDTAEPLPSNISRKSSLQLAASLPLFTELPTRISAVCGAAAILKVLRRTRARTCTFDSHSSLY
jgi:hypothetical protein